MSDKPKNPMTKDDAKRYSRYALQLTIQIWLLNYNSRIQAATAKQNDGKTAKDSFSARAQATADKKQGK